MTDTEIVTLIKSMKAKKIIVERNIEDEDIQLAIDEIKQVIKNYCHVPEVPGALSFTVANMATDLLLYTSEKNAQAKVEIDPSKLDSLNIGDTTIKFANDEMKNSERQQTLNAHKAKLDSLVMDYKSQLNEFRRLF